MCMWCQARSGQLQPGADWFASNTAEAKETPQDAESRSTDAAAVTDPPSRNAAEKPTGDE